MDTTATDTDLTRIFAGLAKLRDPFEPNQIGKLPKPYKKESPKGKCPECGGWHGLPAAHLDYVGHAALTDRLLDVDPFWTWEPMGVDDRGLPAFDALGGLWIRLTILGVTRLGYGDAGGKSGGNAVKEAIGDALRNAGMRFGAALDLWHKGDLHEYQEPEPSEADKARADLLGVLRAQKIAGQVARDKFWSDHDEDLTTSTDVDSIRELITFYLSPNEGK